MSKTLILTLALALTTQSAFADKGLIKTLKQTSQREVALTVQQKLVAITKLELQLDDLNWQIQTAKKSVEANKLTRTISLSVSAASAVAFGLIVIKSGSIQVTGNTALRIQDIGLAVTAALSVAAGTSSLTLAGVSHFVIMIGEGELRELEGRLLVVQEKLAEQKANLK